MTYGARRATVMDGVEYNPRARFRVIKAPCSIAGWKSSGPSAWNGWRRNLEVGDVIVCAGYGPGFGSDPGYGVEFQSEEPGVGTCMFHPMVGSAFDYRPAPGYLEPVEDEEEST